MKKNQSTLCVNPCTLDEIAERVNAVHATLALIRADIAGMTDDETAACALYGLMFTLDAIRVDLEALTN